MTRKDPNARKTPSTTKRMILMLVGVAVIIGGVFAVKYIMGKGMNDFFDNMPQPAAAVTDWTAKEEEWVDAQQAVGTFVAVNGTDVTTEAGGVVRSLSIDVGKPVKAGTVLAQLNTANELAVLKSLEASAKLAAVQRDRWQALARDKLSRKGCDLLVVNDVGGEQVFGRDVTSVRVLSDGGQVLAEVEVGDDDGDIRGRHARGRDDRS